MLTLPEVPGFSLTVDAGSATFPDGSKSGVVSVTVVHVDKIPMVPNFGQQPRFVVTIQPAGVIFDPPVPISIPNVDGMAPGEVTEMYSFDHDLGQFVSIGTGTVSDDGLIVASDPGVGIIKGGWHCGGNPTSTGKAQPATVKITSQKPVILGVDETVVITASGGPSPGSYSWTSSDPSTVEILPPTSGANVSSVTVKLKKVGSATITVRYTCESGAFAEDTVKVGTAVVEMTAHRPNNPPINVVAVPDNVEEFPGAGIRLNGDDDDGNGTRDRNDGLPIGEDDLIKLDLEVNPASPDGIEYVLKRTNGSHLRVWTLDNKGPAVLDANDEKVLNFSSSKMTVWVEAISSGMSFLEFQARSTAKRPHSREEWITIPVPAIVDEATWDRAQKQLYENSRLSHRNNKKHKYLLWGLIRCPRCRGAYSGLSSMAGVGTAASIKSPASRQPVNGVARVLYRPTFLRRW